jgi:hypothetical protein
MDKAIKVLLWLVFTVSFGVSPLFVRYLNARTDEHAIALLDTLRTGDLFIVGAVVAADAIGKILGAKATTGTTPPKVSDHFRRGIKILCACACVALLFAASTEFAQVSGRIDARVGYNSGNVIHDSLVIFLCVVVAGFGVMLVVEE